MWQSNFAQSNGISLHYTRTGKNGDTKPALVLLHGFSDDGLCWSPIAEVLSVSHDVIMVDARGHGRSDGPQNGYGHDQHAADVAGLITSLGLRKPVVMGHSMGAVTTLALAGLYPDLPRAIVLEDPPPIWRQQAAPGSEVERRTRMSNLIIDIKRKTREELIEDNRKHSPTWPEAERGPWADSKLRLSFHVLGDFNQPRNDLHTSVPHMTCPALLITADTALGAIASADDAANLQTLVSHAQVAHIGGAGHNIRREQPKKFVQVVQTFLDSVQ